MIGQEEIKQRLFSHLEDQFKGFGMTPGVRASMQMETDHFLKSLNLGPHVPDVRVLPGRNWGSFVLVFQPTQQITK